MKILHFTKAKTPPQSQRYSLIFSKNWRNWNPIPFHFYFPFLVFLILILTVTRIDSSKPSLSRNGVFERFLQEDSMENFILKSIFGFIGGILLTYICFMFLVFSLNFTLKRATYICMGLGVVLSLGLAFSVKIRCTVFLCIPQLFSKRGRQALLAYAFILALSGPAKNTLHNVEVMSESLACGQEQIKQAENELLKCVQKPNAAAKKSIEKLLEKLNSAVKYFKNFIFQLYRNCFDILETVLHGQKWLYSISLLCHKKMGRPTHRCLNLLSEATASCESQSRWKVWQKLCQIKPQDEQIICHTEAKDVCLRSDILSQLPARKLQSQLFAFKRRAMNILYVRVEAHQTYSQWNRSNAYHEEYQGMATEIRQKTDQFLQYFDFMSVIFGIFILVLFVKVVIYRHRFLTEDHYDNRFITTDFEDIDTARAEFRMETLLPLEPRERMKFIKVTSIRLVSCEKVRLLSSFVFLIFATFKIIIHMLTDSSLYWILSSVRRDERILYLNSIKEEESDVTVRVVGDGIAAALFRNVTKAVKRQSVSTRLDPTPCLPDPVPPDWNRYYQILALVLICWLLALCEPYGLRLRHSVMVTYHPDRARERAIWLYNRIISNRTSFAKIARRELRRKYKKSSIDVTPSFQFMRNQSSLKCLLCKVRVSNGDNYIKCSTANCVGLYCESCFASLKFCSICCDPTEYGDISDLSEEKDSSDEEGSCKCSKQGRTSLRLSQLHEKQKPKRTYADFYLDLKKPLTDRKVSKKFRTKRKYKSKQLLQPTLLMTVVNFIVKKIFGLRRERDLSDVDSSDWEFDSPIYTEESSVAEKSTCKISEKSKTQVASKSERKSEVSVKLTDSKRLKSTKDDKSLKEDKSDKKIQSVELSEKRIQKKLSMVAVRLFKKVSPSKTVIETEKAAGLSSKALMEEDKHDTPKPDFLFRTVEKGPEGDTTEYKPTSFLKAKDSVLKIKQRSGYPKESHSKTNSSGDPNTLEDLKAIPSTSRKHQGTQTFYLETVSLPDKSHLENIKPEDEALSKQSSINEIFPFVDPVTIQQFIPTEGASQTSINSQEVIQAPELTVSKIQDTIKKKSLTHSRARVCFKSNYSSDSVTDNLRICDKDETTTSSIESDCQFYTQPYNESKLTTEPIRSEVKRTTGNLNLNLKPQNYVKLYSIETDSSNERFLTVKPARRVRRKKQKPKIEEQSEILLKMLSNSCRKKNPKKVDFLKAKLVLLFKKNMAGRKSSEEGGTSDMDDVEYMPNTTIFLSDDEFQKLSENLRKKLGTETENKKSKRLTWAPDLLSDLPSSKRKSSGSST